MTTSWPIFIMAFFAATAFLQSIPVAMASYESCETTCNANGGRCNLIREQYRTFYYECWCKPGFTGDNCDHCLDGYFGENCAYPCPTGLWGQNCTKRCECSLPGSMAPNACYAANGNCMCAPGYMRGILEDGKVAPIEIGEHYDCAHQCERGKWGQDCANECECENGASCDHVSGECQCPGEWTGEKCEQPCVKGTAKPGCKFNCDCFAPDQGECDESTGLCGCLPGFMGPRCEWPCPMGFWGAGCHRRCQNCRWCNPANGTCLKIPAGIAQRFFGNGQKVKMPSAEYDNKMDGSNQNTTENENDDYHNQDMVREEEKVSKQPADLASKEKNAYETVTSKANDADGDVEAQEAK